MIAFGRVTDADGAVDSAARAAARAASLERDAGSAQAEARGGGRTPPPRVGVTFQARRAVVCTNRHSRAIEVV
ncbi:pilus assembly protein, partial [[Kitasatospora] papulosa]